VRLGLVLSDGDLLEGRLQLQRRIDENSIGKGDPRTADSGPVGEHELHHLLGKRVQDLSCDRPIASSECGEQLIARGMARAGGEEAEHDVEGERGEGGVSGGSRGGGRRERGGEAEGEACLACDGAADVGGGHGRFRGDGFLDTQAHSREEGRKKVA